MSIELIFISSIAIFLLVVIAQAIRLWKLTGEIQQQKNTLLQLRNEMSALLQCERGMGKRIKQQQQQVRNVIERQDRLEISDGSNTSYKQAVVLLQKGLGTDELIDACDLSRGELELLSRMKAGSNSIATSKAA
jgi:hypothetical protein